MFTPLTTGISICRTSSSLTPTFLSLVKETEMRLLKSKTVSWEWKPTDVVLTIPRSQDPEIIYPVLS